MKEQILAPEAEFFKKSQEMQVYPVSSSALMQQGGQQPPQALQF